MPWKHHIHRTRNWAVTKSDKKTNMNKECHIGLKKLILHFELTVCATVWLFHLKHIGVWVYDHQTVERHLFYFFCRRFWEVTEDVVELLASFRVYYFGILILLEEKCVPIAVISKLVWQATFKVNDKHIILLLMFEINEQWPVGVERSIWFEMVL